MNNAEDLLQIAKKLASQNAEAISAIGARAIVLAKFLDAVLPYLTPSQSAMISHSFRLGIDEVLPLMDGLPVPPEYRAALEETTDGILKALKG